jgi:hypothetical protein
VRLNFLVRRMFCGITRCAACLDLICHIEIVYSIRRACYAKESSICRYQKPALVIKKLFLRTARQCMTFGEGFMKEPCIVEWPYVVHRQCSRARFLECVLGSASCRTQPQILPHHLGTHLLCN